MLSPVTKPEESAPRLKTPEKGGERVRVAPGIRGKEFDPAAAWKSCWVTVIVEPRRLSPAVVEKSPAIAEMLMAEERGAPKLSRVPAPPVKSIVPPATD